MVIIVVEGDYYTHYRGKFKHISFNKLYKELEDKCHNYPITINGNTYTSKLYSCTFSNGITGYGESKLFSYTHLNDYK